MCARRCQRFSRRPASKSRFRLYLLEIDYLWSANDEWSRGQREQNERVSDKDEEKLWSANMACHGLIVWQQSAELCRLTNKCIYPKRPCTAGTWQSREYIQYRFFGFFLCSHLSRWPSISRSFEKESFRFMPKDADYMKCRRWWKCTRPPTESGGVRRKSVSNPHKRVSNTIHDTHKLININSNNPIFMAPFIPGSKFQTLSETISVCWIEFAAHICIQFWYLCRVINAHYKHLYSYYFYDGDAAERKKCKQSRRKSSW